MVDQCRGLTFRPVEIDCAKRQLVAIDCRRFVFSGWLLICTILLALFLSLAKRRHELVSLDTAASEHRQILADPRFDIADTAKLYIAPVGPEVGDVPGDLQVYIVPPWAEPGARAGFLMSWDVVEVFFERLQSQLESVRPLRALIGELRRGGVRATVRWSLGGEIGAACGQLAGRDGGGTPAAGG